MAKLNKTATSLLSEMQRDAADFRHARVLHNFTCRYTPLSRLPIPNPGDTNHNVGHYSRMQVRRSAALQTLGAQGYFRVGAHGGITLTLTTEE